MSLFCNHLFQAQADEHPHNHHTIQTTLVECSQSQARSCHRPCNRPLTCGNHACKLDCHVVETGTKDGTTKAPSLHANLPATACEMCERPCERERPLGCTHKCLLSCHHLACPPCSQFIKMRCHCSMVVRHVVCNEWCGANPQARERLMCCSSRCPKLVGAVCPHVPSPDYITSSDLSLGYIKSLRFCC